MYTDKEFFELETMTDREVREAIKNAEEKLAGYQDRFNELEEEMYAISPLLKPDLDILFRGVKNCERYIRRAENLLEEWDNYRFLIKKRANRIKRIKINSIKKGKLLI